VDRDLSDFLAFAVDPQNALTRRELDIVDVEADDLGDPCAGVERDERDRLVARRVARFDRPEEAHCGALGQCAVVLEHRGVWAAQVHRGPATAARRF
jgi:hypothetical protein